MQTTQLRDRNVSIYSQATNPPLTLIHEKEGRQTYTRYDQLFKELIHTFFQ